MQEEESFIEAYLMELEAEKEVEPEEEDRFEDREEPEAFLGIEENLEESGKESEEIKVSKEPKEEEVESDSIEDFEAILIEPETADLEDAENLSKEIPILLPARGTCRRKPLTNYYREEKGVQRNSWRKEKRKWRPS